MISYSKSEKSSSEQVGQIPADYTQELWNARQRNHRVQATEAALAAYPGASSTALWP